MDAQPIGHTGGERHPSHAEPCPSSTSTLERKHGFAAFWVVCLCLCVFKTNQDELQRQQELGNEVCVVGCVQLGARGRFVVG